MTVVDGHLHLFLRLSVRYPRSVSEIFPADREARVEDCLRVMDAHGVRHAVVVPLDGHHDYVSECLSRYPDRFVGIAVEPKGAAPVDLDALAAAGFRGLRVRRVGNDTNTDRRARVRLEFFEEMAARQLVVWFYSTPAQLELLELVARALPSLQVVLNHLGFCPTEMTLSERGLPQAHVGLPPPTLPQVLSMSRLPNVNVMLSGEYGFSREEFPFSDVSPTVQTIYDHYGPDRMLWASDYPLIAGYPGYAAVRELPALHLPGLSSSDLSKIAGGTARRILRIPKVEW